MIKAFDIKLTNFTSNRGQSIREKELYSIPEHISIDNLLSPRAQTVKSIVGHFLDNRELYNRNAVPYYLNLTLEGECPVEQIALVNAIAAMTGRHVFYINTCHLPSDLNALRDLFYVEKMSRFPENIPVQNRLYVFGTDLYQTSWSKPKIVNVGSRTLHRPNLGTVNVDGPKKPTPISMSDIIYMLNGLEVTNHGRICIFLSKKKLFKALHDTPFNAHTVNLAFLTPDQAGEMLQKIYNTPEKPAVTGYKNMTYNDIIQAVTANPTDVDAVVDQLNAKGIKNSSNEFESTIIPDQPV